MIEWHRNFLQYQNTSPKSAQARIYDGWGIKKQGWEKTCGSTKCAICSLDPQKSLFKNPGERFHSLLGNISLRNLVVPKTTTCMQRASPYGGTNSRCGPTCCSISSECMEHHTACLVMCLPHLWFMHKSFLVYANTSFIY